MISCTAFIQDGGYRFTMALHVLLLLDSYQLSMHCRMAVYVVEVMGLSLQILFVEPASMIDDLSVKYGFSLESVTALTQRYLTILSTLKSSFTLS